MTGFVGQPNRSMVGLNRLWLSTSQPRTRNLKEACIFQIMRHLLIHSYSATNLICHFDLQIWSFPAGAQVGLTHGELSLLGDGVLQKFFMLWVMMDCSLGALVYDAYVLACTWGVLYMFMDRCIIFWGIVLSHALGC